MLLVLVILLASLNAAKAKGLLIPRQPELEVINGAVTLKTMTLEQKIAQMIIVNGDPINREVWKRMQVGGAHLFAMQNAFLFKQTVQQYQDGMKIPLFITVDLEGCLNPFSNFQQFPSASETEQIGKAFEKGAGEGKFLSSLGITINFAPVVDLRDQIWKCRSFPGDDKQIAELAEAYVLGLQKEGIIATAKHYPGKTLEVGDPHKVLVAATIDEEDISPYISLADSVDGIMVSHVISTGEVDSGGIPAVASSAVIDHLKKNYSGLIISDEVNMLGLKDFYATVDEMYIAVFQAGNDLVLNFNTDPNEIYRMIQIVAQAVRDGEIEEDNIDLSVRKVLEAKGFAVR